MIILASKSKARRILFRKCVHNFVAKSSKASEKRFSNETIDEYLKRVTYLKAKRFVKDGVTVVSADTVIFFNGKIVGKAGNEQDAFNMLRTLSGGFHQCVTGVTVITKDKYKFFIDSTLLYMYKLSDKEILDYLKCGEYKHKSGSYSIQGRASEFLEIVNGEIDTVVGLPVKKMCRLYRLKAKSQNRGQV